MEGGKLTHSISQPGGMDHTPPGTPKKGGKMLAVRVQMLDDSITLFQVQAKALGRVLFDQVCKQLHLLESDYFGLEYQEVGGTKYWLDLEKPLSRQIGLSLIDTLVRFCVKFYTPDPSQLEEEFTRYLFCLQIKRDLSQGLLQCNDNTSALMASYIVQAECGDFVAEDYPDHRYLSSYKFVPNQDHELERRIMENHKKHAGQSPAEADLNLLETARRCELYGVKMHSAKDHEGVPLNLAVAHMGIVVFQNYTKINTFSWAKIRKISFKRKRFLVKLHPEGYGYYKDTVEFFFEGRNECKNFWKKCVENHGFFRCSMVKRVPRQKTRVLSRGSSFRYSGRTQKQIVEFVRENYVKRQTFQRSQSFRHSSSAHSSVANVGTSISAHPLLPLGDNAVVGTPASLSCGSMTLNSSPLHAADIHAAASPSPPLTTSVSPGTSVTSSPQHFYPQEIPYRRQVLPAVLATKETPRQGPSAPSTSLQRNQNNAPTSHVITTTTRLASPSNPDPTKTLSRLSLKSPDYTNFNDVYSNCYDSIRNLRNETEKADVAKSDWERSASCKNLNDEIVNDLSMVDRNNYQIDRNDLSGVDRNNYQMDRNDLSGVDRNNYQIDRNDLSEVDRNNYQIGYDSPVTRYDDNRRSCYSAVASKTTSMDVETKVFSSSYPGTTNSLSTESVACETVEVNDSQEEIVLSHDDISHDSYELLERDLEDSLDDSVKSKSRRVASDSDRTRSCSWGSDRGLSPMDSKSSEKIMSPVDSKPSFRSLERGKSPKHKSEGDFRSLDRKSQKNSKISIVKEERKHSLGGRRRSKELIDYETRNYAYEVRRRSKEIEDDVFRTPDRISPLDSRAFSPKALEEKELIRTLEREVRQRKRSKEYDQDSSLERRKYTDRRRSREELELFPMDSEEEYIRDERRRKREKRDREERFHEGIKEKEQEWERERERQEKRRKSVEEEKIKRNGKKMEGEWRRRTREQAEELDKFERVVANQFGRYSEFLTMDQDYELMVNERKVLENYEKVCEVGRMAKELERYEKAMLSPREPSKSIEPIEEPMKKTNEMHAKSQVSQFKEFNAKTKGGVVLGFRASPKGSPKLSGKAPIERTKSDPFDSSKNLRRNVLMHQKSIDLTPQDSGDTTSDYDNEDAPIKQTSRSEHDIPYILHKRHCMNGTAKDTVSTKHVDVSVLAEKVKVQTKKSVPVKKSSLEEPKLPRSIPTSPKLAEAKRSGIEIINMDENESNIIVTPKKSVKVTLAKKPVGKDGKISPKSPIKSPVKREIKKEDSPKIAKPVPIMAKKPDVSMDGDSKTEEEIAKEPIYAVVNKTGKVVVDKAETKQPTTPSGKKTPPEPPKRTSSVQKPTELVLEPKTPDRTISLIKSPSGTLKKTPPEPPKRTTSVPKLNAEKSPEAKTPSQNESKNGFAGDQKEGVKTPVSAEPIADVKKVPAAPLKIKPLTDLPLPSIVPHKREESLILFARTRLGLSEGSAFAPVMRQGHVGSPNSQRRTKSLDAPVVSLHRLPPVDAFSSKDDTVDGGEDVVKSDAAKAAEFFKVELKPPEKPPVSDSLSTESEVDTLIPDDLEIEKNFKETVENQSRFDLSFSDEKVLDVVRSKRLLSKIDSVDAIDSECDLDSSKHGELMKIPLDRIVPESVRFPTVRQISGQTSEESVDGWDPKEVKVKRRTPRRSTGRDEQETGIVESVVWDSKDEEQPDDDVWDDTMVYTNPVITDAVVAQEYLKRGSCGQSIDDDNLSTPMKESSPEHWVSVDDLPEALEREEKLLRAQEKILREKILNEKLKRELNLDTIDVNDRIYRDSFQNSFDDPPLPVLPKEKFKGHSLDTYELTEKRLRERCTNKNPSLDEHILRDDPTTKIYLNISSNLDISDKSSSYENVPKIAKDQRAMGSYIKCKVVNDVNEIDQFEDNDEDLEEFVVVLDENLTDGKEGREIWDDSDSFRRTVSKEESLISVPEEFKDVEEEVEEEIKEEVAAPVEIRLDNGSHRLKTGEEHLLESQLLEEKLKSMTGSEDAGRLSPYNGSRRSSEDPRRLSASEDPGRLSPYDGSRRGSDDNRRLSASEDTGRLSPYDYSSRRSSDDPLRLSASDDTGRLSPFDDSRRGSEDPRRLSTSEDSRRLSASEDSRKFSLSEDSRRLSTSVSEETRRRLSSTEETRRKRASLTKQCSVGVDSLSDDIIPGIQECSSSFEQDEKDVFESAVEPVLESSKDDERFADAVVSKSQDPPEEHSVKDVPSEKSDIQEIRKLEIEVSEEISIDQSDTKTEDSKETESDLNHLAPPARERELSRETEDSMDYGEGDFKEIREAVKEKDISDGLICDSDSVNNAAIQISKLPSSFEKSESSEGDEMRFIDDKRGNTPEIIVGKGKATAAISVVVVNEGIAVLDKIVERDRILQDASRTQSLPRSIVVTDADKEAGASGLRHTLPKRGVKPKTLPKPEYIHRKLTKAVPNLKIGKPKQVPISESRSLTDISQDSSQDSDADRLCEVSVLAQIQSQIARRNLLEEGRRLRKDYFFDTQTIPIVKVFQEVEDSSKEEKLLWRQRTSLEEEEQEKLSEGTPTEDVSPIDKLKDVPAAKSCADGRKDIRIDVEKKSPDQEKRDSGEDMSSSSSAPPNPKRELSSTWRPFLLESSGSSSLEEGWLPPDDNAHLADEEETSSTSNNQQDDSLHDDIIDYPASAGYPVLSISSAEMIVGGYGSVFSLSRTLSRISERSTTSEQERSDVEDDITKPSSHSVSVEEESILSSDHQPSLSSDPPSPKASSSKIPDLPEDQSPIPEHFAIPEDKTPVCEPFGDFIPPPLTDDDWPSPPTSSSMFDTPVVSHIETFYMEIHPEEACKVVVAERHEDNSSSDENHTLHEDNLTLSTTTTTQDGTVIMPVRPRNLRNNSMSEDTSDWSRNQFSASDDIASDNLGSRSDWQPSSKSGDTSHGGCISDWSSPGPSKPRPPKLKSPTGFYETPTSKVRSPTSLVMYSTLRSPTSHSEASSPKNHGRFFEPAKELQDVTQEIIERENNNVLSSTPLQNGKVNGVNHCVVDGEPLKSPNLTPVKNRRDETSILSELSLNDANANKTERTASLDSSGKPGGLVGGEISETRKKRYNTDRGYFIAKELLSTERTYKKDLELINIWFRDETSKSEDEMPDDVLTGLFNLVDPLDETHSNFLRELEQRLGLWEGRSNAHLKGDMQKIGDVVLHHFNTTLPLYAKYLDKHQLVLERLDAAFRKNKKFEQIYRDFELQRVCYLPLSAFIMKPLQRLVHYSNLLDRLMKHYGTDHADFKDCAVAKTKLAPVADGVPDVLQVSENFVQLSELQRDMPGFEGLIQGGRGFIRQGCLLKHCRKGFQQRMFFLFSDTLVYTNRTTTPSLHFKVHGQIPLRGVMVEDADDRSGPGHCFTVYGGNRTLQLAASSQEEKDKWLEDLYDAVQCARERNDGKLLQYLSLKSCSSSDEIMDRAGEEQQGGREKASQQRSNTTVHVCWHRNTSTSLVDQLRAFENELSGFLLRKFKNSNGWQKLWVVFTHFCLFFYKTYLDDSPLASLPLLGYTVTVPSEADEIHKDYVFKLQFKNHVYFFRAESEYTFSRWMEVIRSATLNSSRLRLFSRKDSSLKTNN